MNQVNPDSSPANSGFEAGIDWASPRLEMAARHIQSARDYTLTLLQGLSDEDWFWTPDPPITHIAWQIGHLAFAEYGLVLFRQRGRLPEDAELMSGSFRKAFAKGTTPSADRSDYPDIVEIRRTFDNVHRQALRELAAMKDAGLDEGIDPPHAAFASKFGALLFAADHEMLHAGQIGLLRRLMNKPPIR
jgi:DinB superfamily